MPKDKRKGPAKSQENRSRPYKARGKAPEGDNVGDQDAREDWEDALCPICLEAPHNAVLLVCSSYADGCRPYMCNTSHRHSNCLDQFQKTQAGLQKLQSPLQAVSISEGHSQQMVVNTFQAGNTLNLRIVDAYPTPPAPRPVRASPTSDDVDMENVIIEALNSRMASGDSTIVPRRSRRTMRPLRNLSRQEAEAAGFHFLDSETGSEAEGLEGSSSLSAHPAGSSSKSKPLICPLCRGQIFGWRVVNAARKYFNSKARNCLHESCMFAGTYQELRVHARCEHPCASPCEVDPARQREWLRMERQREIGDVLSTIGASNEDESSEDGRWWSYLFLLHFFRPVNEESSLFQVQDHQQLVGAHRAASASLRNLIENMNWAADGTSIATESRTEGEPTTRRPLSRQPRRRRGVS